MTEDNGAQGINGNELGDAPLPWDDSSSNSHAHGADDAKGKGVLETFKKSWQLFKERCVFDFFGGGTPLHVDFEEVGQDSL